MKIDLEAEVQNIDRLLTQAQTKAAYWTDEAKKLEGAKAFAEHLLEIAEKDEPVAPPPGMFPDMDDDAHEGSAPVLVGSGSNGSRP